MVGREKEEVGEDSKMGRGKKRLEWKVVEEVKEDASRQREET